MDRAERPVAVALALLALVQDDDAERGQVVDLVELLAALGHLLVDGVEVLRAARDLCRDPELLKLLPEQLARLGDELLAVVPALVHHRLDLDIAPRVQRLEGEILELPLDRVDTEPVRERCVHLERLARLLVLLLLAEVLDRSHVVEAIGELDEDDPRVVRHRDDHLPIVLGLRLLAALKVDSRQLGDAFDEPGNLFPELGPDVLDGRVRVLDDVVQERRGERGIVTVKTRQDLGHSERVGDEVLPASAVLAFVGVAGEPEGALDQVSVDVRVVRGDIVQEGLEGLLMTPPRSLADDLGHRPSVASGLPGLTGPAGWLGPGDRLSWAV